MPGTDPQQLPPGDEHEHRGQVGQLLQPGADRQYPARSELAAPVSEAMMARNSTVVSAPLLAGPASPGPAGQGPDQEPEHRGRCREPRQLVEDGGSRNGTWRGQANGSLTRRPSGHSVREYQKTSLCIYSAPSASA
jgi:hypothetical protein